SIPQDLVERLALELEPWTGRPLSPIKPTIALRTPRGDLPERERRRHANYARSILARDAQRLARMNRNTGRNAAAFRLACRVGRWAHHGVIPAELITDTIMDACNRNGLVKEEGTRAVLATIASGLRKSSADTLPTLGARP